MYGASDRVDMWANYGPYMELIIVHTYGPCMELDFNGGFDDMGAGY